MKTSLGDKIFVVINSAILICLLYYHSVSDLVCILCIHDIEHLSGFPSGYFAVAT
mgnify:CR=1 FL=1